MFSVLVLVVFKNTLLAKQRHRFAGINLSFTSISLSWLLCCSVHSCLHCHVVLSTAEDTGNTFYSMFFSSDKPFEEFFCIIVQLLNKTWREMRATTADFPKVRVHLSAFLSPSALVLFLSSSFRYLCVYVTAWQSNASLFFPFLFYVFIAKRQLEQRVTSMRKYKKMKERQATITK